MQFTKHHGLGNDFLVMLTEALPSDASARAIELCDRYTGIGADGLIYGIGQAYTKMRLFNADGSEAAVSGNGLRCLTQALAIQGGNLGTTNAGTQKVSSLNPAPAKHSGDSVGTYEIETSAGTRLCKLQRSDSANTSNVSVEMGEVASGPEVDPDLMCKVANDLGVAQHSLGVLRWQTGDIGNPHIICEVADPASIDVATIGPAIERYFEGGINVSFVVPHTEDEDSVRDSELGVFDLRVWERGVGVTRACGTAAVVAAWVLHQWGSLGKKARVLMPGGHAHVDLNEPVTLSGPTTFVAHIEVAHD